MRILSFLCLIAFGQASENVHNKIYSQLDPTMPCILLLNGSQSFGCTSSRSGNVGVIHLVYNDSSLKWITDSSKDNTYIAVLNINMFTLSNLRKLNDSATVNGILLVQKEKRSQITQFSPESQCPNRYSGLADAAHNYSSDVCEKDPWNKAGSEIAKQRWNMPMFFIDDESTIKDVETCFQNFNLPLNDQANRALCALELSSHMFASGDSTKCNRRNYPRYNFNPISYCDPLANENIYAPVIPIDKFDRSRNNSYIFVSARLDSASLFYGRATGALSTATSIVALLLTSNLLTRLLINNTYTANKNVMFLLFNGEAYDYIGSQKVVYDMENANFPFKEAPLNLDDIGLFIELSQLKNNEILRYHTYDNLTRSDIPLIEEFIDKFKKIEARFNINSGIVESHTKGRFPPSSYQSFLARKAIPGFVFASYKNQFQNMFYQSVYDDAENLNYEYANGSKIENTTLASFLANFSTVFAHTLYAQITEKDAPTNLNITNEVADELLHCFIDSPGCEFFSRFEESGLSDLNLDYYVSVASAPAHMTALSRDSLAYLMGRNVSATNRDDCFAKGKDIPFYTYLWVQNESQCLESYVNSSFAISPAFTIPEYKLEEGIYSSWTESTWQNLSVRMFRKPSLRYEWLVCTIGFSILTSSFLILFWIRRNSRELFNFPHLIATSSI